MGGVKLAFLLVCLSFFACQGDLTQLEPLNQSAKAETLDAKKWFDKNYDQPVLHDLKSRKIEPLWETALVSYKGIEVLFLEKSLLISPKLGESLNNSGKRRLRFVKKGTDYDISIVSYLPSEEFKGDIQNIVLNNYKKSKFAGLIIHENISDSVNIRLWLVKDGNVSKSIASKIHKNRDVKECCISYQICRETKVCWTIDGVFTCVDLASDCDYTYDCSLCDNGNTTCQDYPCICDPNGPGCDPNCQEPDPCNCNPDQPGCDCPFSDPCVCDPNALGCNNNQGIQTVIGVEDLLTGCNKEALNKVSTGLSGDFATFLNEFRSQSSNINLLFKEQYFQGNEIDWSAKTSPLIDNTITITLNRNVTDFASQEFVAVTIYHEVIHAYLTAYFSSAFAQSGNINDAHHQYMAQSCVQYLANALKEMFPGLSDFDSKALAWEGLNGNYENPNRDGSPTIPNPYWGAVEPDLRGPYVMKNNEYRSGTNGTHSPTPCR